MNEAGIERSNEGADLGRIEGVNREANACGKGPGRARRWDARVRRASKWGIERCIDGMRGGTIGKGEGPRER